MKTPESIGISRQYTQRYLFVLKPKTLNWKRWNYDRTLSYSMHHARYNTEYNRHITQPIAIKLNPLLANLYKCPIKTAKRHLIMSTNRNAGRFNKTWKVRQTSTTPLLMRAAVRNRRHDGTSTYNAYTTHSYP